MTAPARRPSPLPETCPPAGLSRVEAAAYVGISPGTFDRLVADGLMPRAKQIYSRRVWDRRALDAAFAALPDEPSAAGDIHAAHVDGATPWGDVAV